MNTTERPTVGTIQPGSRWRTRFASDASSGHPLELVVMRPPREDLQHRRYVEVHQLHSGRRTTVSTDRLLKRFEYQGTVSDQEFEQLSAPRTRRYLPGPQQVLNAIQAVAQDPSVPEEAARAMARQQRIDFDQLDPLAQETFIQDMEQLVGLIVQRTTTAVEDLVKERVR